MTLEFYSARPRNARRILVQRPATSSSLSAASKASIASGSVEIYLFDCTLERKHRAGEIAMEITFSEEEEENRCDLAELNQQEKEQSL